MAVIDETPGLEMQIHVNGQPLREYSNADRPDVLLVADKTSERCVEVQSGKIFEIHYSFSPPFAADRPVSMIVTINGEDVDEPLIRPDDLYGANGHVSSGVVSGDGERWFRQKYRFASLHIEECNEEHVPDHLKKKLESVGIITCEFYFLENLRCSPRFRSLRKELERLETVNEKAIKGESLSHQAILGDNEPSEEIEYFDAEYADGGEPFATFHFYYRSLATLKDLHIIERTPDPLELLASNDSVIGQVNREQLEAIVRRFGEEETLLRDDDDIDHHSGVIEPDVVETHSIDLRKKRKLERVRQLPSDDIEVSELD
ncbi:hypothetical protein BDW02DRAFT_601471 [Decorospora gaudefroyi]|uniref:DUF7918 domain-containing protein n=1 Tax=Decorospora gaudefroyi TaxID=184978 RepID=A0A6A5K1L4_9PLEO|nr:hypothetical protein BDW02DRAFT_601471 [Decorospora gaudefroyi]